MVVFVGFVFSGGMPFLLILSAIGLIGRYFYFKWSFIKYCRIPKAYDESMNDRAILLIFGTILLHILASIWMYGV